MGYFNKKPNILSKIWLIVSIIIVITGIFTLGWFSNNLFNDLTNKRLVDGLRFQTDNSHTNALEVAEKYDKYGDWICVNIKGMEYKRALEVCSHEVGHEIFAEECEKDINKCMEITK